MTLALVLPQGLEYARRIRQGVVRGMERVSGWQVLQLPMHQSGRAPVRLGMDSLDGVITWAESRDRWVRSLAAKGVPVVNCTGDWQETAGVASVVVNLRSVLELAVRHFRDLGLQKVILFGSRVSSDPARGAVAGLLRELAEPEGIEVTCLETRGRNPDEILDSLLVPASEHELIHQFAALKGSHGMFAENDYHARLACDLAALAGKRVPMDIAILGADGDLLSRFGSPTISTIILPGEEIGQKAFHLIDSFHRGVSFPTGRIEVMATTIVVRESTCGKAPDVVMDRVFRWIERETCRGLTVQELPEVAGMSLSTLRRRYRAVYGMEPSEHIRTLWVAKARELLESGDQPVVEIAAACGFSAQAAFANYFHRHTGMTPTEHRQRAKVK